MLKRYQQDSDCGLLSRPLHPMAYELRATWIPLNFTRRIGLKPAGLELPVWMRKSGNTLMPPRHMHDPYIINSIIFLMNPVSRT